MIKLDTFFSPTLCWIVCYQLAQVFRAEIAVVFRVELMEMPGLVNFVAWGLWVVVEFDQGHELLVFLDISCCCGVR
jgi:hypothetical protein